MAKKRKAKKKKHRLFWFLVKLQIFLMFVVLSGYLYYNYGGYAKQLQAIRKEAVQMVRESKDSTFIPSQTSIVYDTNGNLISFIKGEKEADYVEYEDIPANFVSAMVSIEDKRFYQHSGIDLVALARSAKAILESGSLSQGGSTITMQLARNIYLDTGKRWERKIKEMFIAIELEKLYSKNKIMEYYLNNIYFANGYYGIQAACTGYFSCDLKDLTLSQAAFLCAIPNSPSYYDPIVNYDNTIERRNRILTNMYEDGKIDEPTYLGALREEIVLQPSQATKSQRNNYVDTYVYYCATRALMELRGFEFKEYFSSEEEKKAYYEAYDELYSDCQKQIYSEGYKIYTSIDMTKQDALQNSLNTVLSGFTEKGEGGAYQMQGSSVCIDNETGYVVAIVGGREQKELGIYTLNRAYQSHRQPGSSIKPLIVYTPFFEKGNTPDALVKDEAVEGGPNMSYYHGEVTARYAVQWSLNPAAWNVYAQITPEVGLQYLKNMHFTEIKQNDYVLPTALGGFTRGTSAVEMAAAYCTLENDGVYREPTCIKKIVDASENIVYVSKQEGTKIYHETAARMMTDVLHSTVTDGISQVAAIAGMPSAGKTGTTNDNKDGWYVGYTRYYTTSVWVGCDIPKAVEGLGGSTYPAQIWKDYMTKIHEGLAPMNFLPYAQLSQEFIDQYYPPKPEEPEVEENPVEDENQVEGENSVEDENQVEDENPVEDENQVEGENPIEGENQVEDENQVENENPIQDESPAEGENVEENQEVLEDAAEM